MAAGELTGLDAEPIVHDAAQPIALVAAFTVAKGRIVAIDIIADPGKLRGLDLG